MSGCFTEYILSRRLTVQWGIVMAQQNNVEIVKQVFAAFNRGDEEEFGDMMTDDATWTEPEGSALVGGTFHGRDEVLKNVFTPPRQQIKDMETTPERFIDAGDTVIVEGKYGGTASDGNHFEIPYAAVLDMQDGKIQRFANYEDTALAHNAFGT